MAKHNRHNKKNLKKRVKHNAKKLKELTAEDLLMNPGLLQSPQFLQLPMEKQFQLIAQLKQLRAMLSNKAGGATPQTPGNDPSLFAKVNELNNKVARQAKENEQLRISENNALEAYKREKQLSKDIKLKTNEQKAAVDQSNRIEELEQEKRILDTRVANAELKLLREEVKQKQKLAHYNELQEKQIENQRLNTELQLLSAYTGTPQATSSTKVKKFYTPRSEGKTRVISESYHQSWNDKLNNQQIFQNQINTYTENGDNDKAEKTEKNLLSINNSNDNTTFIEESENEDDLKKKALLTEPNSDDNNNDNDNVDVEYDEYGSDEEFAKNIPMPPLSPVERNAIKAEVLLDKRNQTRKEQISQLEELEKVKKQNQEKMDRNLVEATHVAPNTILSKLDFENNKSGLYEELDGVINLVEHPNDKYIEGITQKIDNAKTYDELKIIERKLKLDKSNQEEFIKQSQLLEEKKKECFKKLQEPQKYSISYSIPLDIWRAKIKDAKTTEDIIKIDNMINLYHQIIKVLAQDEVEQKQKSKDKSTHREAKARAEAAVDNFIKIQHFLKERNEEAKPKAYIDGDKEKEFSPGTKGLRPTDDVEYVDISNYKYDPKKDSIPNEVLLNGINISNFIERGKESTEKGKFWASLAWKLTCYLHDKGSDVFFWLVELGGQLFVAAVPKLIEAAGQNPTATTARVDGLVLWKCVKGKFSGSKKDLSNSNKKINDEKIIDLRSKMKEWLK